MSNYTNANRLHSQSCVQWIDPPEGGRTRTCAKKAQWFVCDGEERGVCSTHKRNCDYRRIVR